MLDYLQRSHLLFGEKLDSFCLEHIVYGTQINIEFMTRTKKGQLRFPVSKVLHKDNMAVRPPEPHEIDSPDALVHCIDGKYNGKQIKLRMLKNLSDGFYKKARECTYESPVTGERFPCYRWIPNK